MEMLRELLLAMADWIRPHSDNIALALIATLLVIYGDEINRIVKQQLRPYPYIIRLIGFVVLCAFGYGALTVYATPVLEDIINRIPGLYLAPAIMLLFLLVGLLAERRRQI
ncbi:DUF3392 family protein [Oceanospirillum linum]|uniref:DUF3392 domain-containing protein n=1 Tax=Oceanospirillum linum TaxID=966 RepID=A0A1T1HB22_OCELI|nr:DUF3392 family protein [Oceanospirillum linum]OOV87012.1 hypothetical protein BTA35_0208335 [Oceanospirillum linum]SEF71542.1 Protein of unknown function [Oleiphilus messinensis]SMP15645.1 Protein of unknown function [Oceanospirillum linum]